MDTRRLVKELSESRDGKTGFEKQFDVSDDCMVWLVISVECIFNATATGAAKPEDNSRL